MKNEKLLLLIKAPYYDDYGPMKKAAGTYFPLGLGYISSYLKERGYDAALIDPDVQSVSKEQIAERVAADNPALVGISFMTPQFHTAKDICKAIRKSAPGVQIVLGGAHPSALPEETLAEIPEADFAVVLEGEEASFELMKSLETGAPSLKEIRGLVWRDGDNIVVNEARAPVADLDSLPFPDRGLIDQSLYRVQSFFSYSKNTATIYTSRGCPGKCVFCCSGHRLRAPVRERGMESIMAEIEHIRSEYGADYLMIKDDTFTFRKTRVYEFCDAIEKNHPGLKWHCMGRANTVDFPLLKRMKEAGLNDIFFGIESGNAEIIKRAKKGITPEQSRNAVEACRRLGIRAYGAFILGLPGETRETAEETIRFACSLPLTMAGFSILIPYPGTTVYEEHFDKGCGPADYSSFVASSGIHYTRAYTGMNGLTPEELPALMARAQRRFYLRPAQIARMIRSASPRMISGYFRGFFSLVAKERFRRRAGKAAG